MTTREMLKRAPNTVLIVCGTVLALAVIGSITLLSIKHSDTAQLTQFVNVILNFAGLFLSAGAMTAASSAADSAQHMEHEVKKINGNGNTDKGGETDNGRRPSV